MICHPFLPRLSAKPNILNVISTHYYAIDFFSGSVNFHIPIERADDIKPMPSKDRAAFNIDEFEEVLMKLIYCIC